MLTVFWDIKEPIAIDFQEKDTAINNTPLLPTPLEKNHFTN